jgi:hypothetical protein
MHLYRPDIAFPTSFGEDQTSLNIVAIETPESVVLEAGTVMVSSGSTFHQDDLSAASHTGHGLLSYRRQSPALIVCQLRFFGDHHCARSEQLPARADHIPVALAPRRWPLRGGEGAAGTDVLRVLTALL